MSKLVIFEYNSDTIHIFDIISDVIIDDSYIQSLGFSISSCDWKISDHLSVEFHNTAL